MVVDRGNFGYIQNIKKKIYICISNYNGIATFIFSMELLNHLCMLRLELVIIILGDDPMLHEDNL